MSPPERPGFRDLLRPDRLRRWVRWVPFALILVVVAVRASTGGIPRESYRASPEMREEAFRIIAGAEPGMRRSAERSFPFDPWSQDDAYHAMEWRRAMQYADQRGLSLGEVLKAIDDGMREGWAKQPSMMRNTVPPCHPRPID